jgi:hypothetical protein
MEAELETPTQKKLTLSDMFFLGFLCFAVVGVAWVGYLSFKAGMKTETTKRNGEAWAKWLTDAGVARHKEGFLPGECAAGVFPLGAVVPSAAPAASAPEASPEKSDTLATTATGPRTWGDCQAALSKPESPLGDVRNPFLDKPLELIEKCDRSNRSVAGSMVLEKLTPTPPGSAVPHTPSQLMPADPIDQKLQLRVTMCDSGGYPIRIAEVEF